MICVFFLTLVLPERCRARRGHSRVCEERRLLHLWASAQVPHRFSQGGGAAAGAVVRQKAQKIPFLPLPLYQCSAIAQDLFPLEEWMSSHCMQIIPHGQIERCIFKHDVGLCIHDHHEELIWLIGEVNKICSTRWSNELINVLCDAAMAAPLLLLSHAGSRELLRGDTCWWIIKTADWNSAACLFEGPDIYVVLVS